MGTLSGINGEKALRAANHKYEKRLEKVKEIYGEDISRASLEEKNQMWKKAKETLKPT